MYSSVSKKFPSEKGNKKKTKGMCVSTNLCLCQTVRGPAGATIFPELAIKLGPAPQESSCPSPSPLPPLPLLESLRR